jgi:hypothetical protein
MARTTNVDLSCCRRTLPLSCFRTWLLGLLLLTQALAASPLRGTEVELLVEPARVSFTCADESAQLLVTLKLSDGTVRDVTRSVRYDVATPAVAVVALGRVLPQGEGAGEINVIWADANAGKNLTAKVAVQVERFTPRSQWSFTNDVLPLLTKHGCNGGACHGKAVGQNGFKLSLFGFDPQQDYAAIVHDALGRRVSPGAPDDSLLLLKATAKVAHGGGQRFATDTDAYRRLLEWIAQGAAWGPATEPTDVNLEVFPGERSFQAPGEQQLRVVVHYSDGSTRDVTPWARYDGQQPDLLTVSADGLVTTTGRGGEGVVMVRFQNSVGMSNILSLTSPAQPDAAYAAFQPRNFIDEIALAKWRKLHLTPSAAASDEEFLRRVYIDALGSLPEPQEVRDFVADTSPEKRDALIDRILVSEEFLDLWAHRMGDLLRNRVGDSNGNGNSVDFAKWIRQSLAENKPYDQFARDILTVTGKRNEHPQMDWYRWAINPENRVEDTAQAFLGKRVSCANCHDHPFENIRQTDYWQFAAFFARLKSVTYGNVEELGLLDKGETKHPRTEQVLNPKPFGGPEFEYVQGEDPRVKLADWLTAPDNPFFARAICNRIWGHYLGVGLVHPVDDMRITNPPSNSELLDALAREFVAHQFDLKWLMKTILKSQVYGLSSTPTDDNQSDTRNYARYYSRRLHPHVLLDAISSATSIPVTFEKFPDVKKAIQLPNESARSEFLDIFGRSQRVTPCECETSLAPNLSQVLYLLNSDELERKLTDKAGLVSELAKSENPPREIIDELFLRTFSRLPREAEVRAAVAQFEKANDRRAPIEDLLWTLLNSKEFLFNH